MISNIGIIHISPKADGSRKVFPHSLIFPYTFLTFPDKGIQSVFFNLLLTIKTKLLLYLQLYRKAMGIPACLTGNHISLHGTVSGDHILDNTCQHMPDMGLSVGSRRTVIKGIRRSFLTVFHTLFENVIVFPEFFNFFFTADKIHVS